MNKPAAEGEEKEEGGEDEGPEGEEKAEGGKAKKVSAWQAAVPVHLP